jgi:hypothetical protein
MNTPHPTPSAPSLKAVQKAARRVPAAARDGSLCGLACEVCPLRPWKSASMTDIVCTDVLKKCRHRRARARR